MPDLREYFYPYVDQSQNMAYEYYYAGTSNPYYKMEITNGISIAGYPTASGSTYFTRKDAYWDGSGYNDEINWWYMRQRDTSIIEEIADDAYGNLVYYNDKVITHAHGDSGTYECLPICVYWRGGDGTFHNHAVGRLWSSCTYVQYHATWSGYSDVVEMNFAHGSYWGGQPSQPCTNNPSGYEYKAPYISFWVTKWFAKNIGKIYGRIMFYEDYCNGYLTQGSAWDYTLHTMYGI